MDKLQQVYDLYLSQGLLSDNISFEQFSTADEEQQNKLYTLGKEKGLFSSTGADTFKSAWGSQSFQTDPVKETASAGSKNQAVSMVSASEDGSLELTGEIKADRDRLISEMSLNDNEAKLIEDEVKNISFEPTIVGTYMGATYESIPFEEQLKEAEENLKKAGGSYNKSDIEAEAKNIIKTNKTKQLINAKHEETLEEIKDKKVGWGRAWWDAATSLLPDSWGIGDSEEYANYRKALTASIEDPGLSKEYADGMLRLEMNARGIKEAAKELNKYKSITDFGGTLNNAEIERYNTLLSQLKAYEKTTEEEVNNLTALGAKMQSLEELADLTKRSYSNVDIAQAGVANFFSSTILGGLSKIEEKTTITSLAKEWVGVDLTNPEDLTMLPEELRGIVSSTFEGAKLKEEIYSDIAEYGFEQGYRIKENVEKNQELGKVQSAEDFFEFTLNLFSEQAGNTAITAGVPYAGLALVSMGSAGQKMHEMDIERANGEKISAAQYYGAALMSFAAEYLTEKVSLSNFNKLAKVNYAKAFELNDALSLDINKLTYGTAWGNWLKSQGGEGLAEAGSQFINNISDKYILGKDISLTDGLDEAFASGAIMSGLGFNAPVLAADLVNAFTANKDIQAHNRVMRDIVDTTAEINKLTKIAKTDPSVKPLIADLQSRLDSLYDKSITYIENAADRTDSLSKLDRQSLLNIDAEVYKLKKQIDKINADPNLSAEAKKNQITFLAESINGLGTHKESILNEAQYGKDVARTREFQNNEIIKNGLQGEVQLIEAADGKDFLAKAKEVLSKALSDGKITEDQAKKLEAQALEASQKKSHGFQFGAEYGLPLVVALSKNATDGKLGNSTVLSHEIGHGVFFRNLLSQGADVIALVDMMEAYARKNIKGADKIFDQVKIDYAELIDPESKDYNLQTFAEERFLALKDAYRKQRNIRRLDKTFSGKLINAWNKIKGKDKTSDTEVKTGEDVFNLMTSFVDSFETGTISGSFKALMEGNLTVAKQRAADRAKKSKIKESRVYNASPKSFAQLGERTGLIYLATDKKEADAYAEMNRGEVKDIFINDNVVASEQDLISTMQGLGINTTEGLTYELIDPRFEDFYIGKANMKKVTDALAEKGFKAARYEDGSQVIPGKAESIVVFDKSAISDKKGGIKFSKITPSQKDMNDRVDNLVGKKDESGNYTWNSKEAWQMSDEFANTYEQIIGGNLIDPLIRRGLEGEDVYGVPMQDFIEKVKSEGNQSVTQLLINFDPTKNNSLIGYINSLLQKRKVGVLDKLKKAAALGSKSIDTAAGEAGAVTGAEMMSTEEADAGIELEERAAREAAEVKKPLKDRLKFGKAKEKVIARLQEKLAERVKYRISLFDATKSKNKFTTDFVRDLHKDLQEAAYEIIMEGMNPQDIQAFEQFLSDNYVDILDGLTTTYLSRAFPQVIQKKIVGEGWVNYPKWKGAKRGAKKGDVEFWKATEEGPYKGNTSGPQKIRRIKNIRNTIPKQEFVSNYVKGGAVVERTTEALAKQIAAEMSLDILVDEIKNDGDIAQALFERQELIRGMASTMAANDVIAQIERPGIKFSKVGNTGFNKLDDARRAHNKYLFSKPEATRERILDGEIDDPEYNKLYNALERAHLEYLSRARNNQLTDIQQEKFKKFERYDFADDAVGFKKLIEAQVRYNDYSFTQLINEIAEAFQTAIKKITSDDIGYDNKSKAKRQKYKNDVNSIIMPYADSLINAAETNNDKVEIINELIEFIGGSYAFKGFANNAEFKKEFIDPLAARHGLDPNSWTLEKVVGGQSIFYKGNKVATIYKQESGAADIASVIKSKDGKITNTIDIKERNKKAKQISKRYMHFANYVKKEFLKGRISFFELGRISNALHSGYMRAAGKALAQVKGIVLYEGLYDPKDYTYEHTPPSNTLKRAFLLYVTGVRPLELQKVVDNSSVVVLPTEMANIVDEIYQSSMGKEYKPGDDFKTILKNRYFDPTVQKLIEQSGFELSLQTIQDANSEYFVRAKKQTASIKQSKRKLVKNNNALLPTAQQIKGEYITNQQVLDKMAELDKEAAEIRFSKINPEMLNKQFNVMLEQTTGIKSESEFSEARAKMDGKLSGKKWWFIPPSAQDFMGLMYAFVAKGKTGEAQLKWIQRNLINPYARAAQEITRARRAMYRDYEALKKELKIVPKNLKQKIPGSSFTVQHAVRAYIFTQEGHEIPGLTEKEARELKQYVQERPELIEFAEKIRSLLKGTQMAKPRTSWTGGTITTDLLETLNTTKRAEALADWQANVDAIFSKENLNKIEALYGSNFRWALENVLTRMKTGRNRNYGPDSQVGKWMDWLNSQTGTIMFFNMRSAVLQTISTINFMNWSDNNPLEAAKAFANQKQYWTDFFMLFNSDFLVDRRDGLKMEVNESDIADMAKEGMSFQAIVNKVLKAGFVPTQIADSFAIAAGGAAFYRNRLNRYIKEGMEPDKAAEQAFMDFRETAEESQQSSRPDKISAQQAGNLGRFILAFANTPAQYARLMNRAYLDLKNGRGDAKTNISKIIYYGVAQNLLFNALQQALFAFAFDEDEEEEKEKNEKYLGIANGMFDSVLRGIGVHGAIIATLKNTAIALYKESGKDLYKQELGKQAVIGLSGIAPPLNSKIRKLYKAGDIYKYNNKEIQEMGWDIDNPALLAAANVISSVSNLPTDRMVQKSININDALTEDITTMQRLALFAGWSGWNLKIPKYDRTSQSSSSRGKGFNRKRRGFKPRKF